MFERGRSTLKLLAILSLLGPLLFSFAPSAAAPAAVPPLTGGPDSFGYTWDRTVPFEWIDVRDGFAVPFPRANMVGHYQIGFDFRFYDLVTDFIDIGPGYLGGEFSGQVQCIPSALEPDGMIAPFWDALWSATISGHVFCKTLGSAPSRRFVVEWYQVCTVTDFRPMTFEVVLFEGSNDILFQYLSMSLHPHGTGGWAAVGIEDLDGKHGLQVSCRQPWITDESAVRYYYPGSAPTPTASPTPSPTSSATLSASATATPSATATLPVAPTPSATATLTSPSATPSASATAETPTRTRTPTITPTRTRTPTRLAGYKLYLPVIVRGS